MFSTPLSLNTGPFDPGSARPLRLDERGAPDVIAFERPVARLHRPSALDSPLEAAASPAVTLATITPLELSDSHEDSPQHPRPIASTSNPIGDCLRAAGLITLTTVAVLDCILSIHNAVFWQQLSQQPGCDTTRLNLPLYGKPDNPFHCPDECYPIATSNCTLLGQSLAGVHMGADQVEAFYAKYTHDELLLTNTHEPFIALTAQIALACATITLLGITSHIAHQSRSMQRSDALGITAAMSVACLFATKVLSIEPMKNASGFYPPSLIRLSQSVNFFYLSLVGAPLALCALSCIASGFYGICGRPQPTRTTPAVEV